MPRPPRGDADGVVFHVMNRGGAKRTVLESRADFRYFISRLAYTVRREELEVLGFSLLMTHFHLLVRSRGGLSEALRRIQNEYVRYFNRSRGRDGSLFRGRFLARPVRGATYLRNCFLYIDENPVQARLTSRPEAWPWGSAQRFAQGRPGPWLSNWALDRLEVTYGPGIPLPPYAIRRARAGLIEARLHATTASIDPLDDLVSAVPEQVRDWMVRKAQLSDGPEPGLPLAPVSQVISVLDAKAADLNGRTVRLCGTNRHALTRLLRVGLLRDLAAATFVRIGQCVQRSPANARSQYDLHRRALMEDVDYASLASALAQEVIAPFTWVRPEGTEP